MHSVDELRRALAAERAISQEQALIPGLMQHDLSNIISRVSLSVSAMSLAGDEAERARWMREVEGGLSMAGQMLDGMRTMFISGAAVPDVAEDDFVSDFEDESDELEDSELDDSDFDDDEEDDDEELRLSVL